MAEKSGGAKISPLTQEHQYLSASLERNLLGRYVPQYYGDGMAEPAALREGAAVSDVSGLAGYIIEGDPARAFVSMAFTAPELAPGHVAVTLCLAGDGRVVAPVLLACTAATEFALWTASECAEGLKSWLEALIGAEQDGVKPFDGVKLSDESQSIAALCMAGPKARKILGDYAIVLPESNGIIDGRLDEIGCVMAQVKLDPYPVFLIWTHEEQARILWRSFLSFQEVEPVGASALWAYVGEAYPGILQFLDDPILPVKPADLKISNLLRPEGNFVGARALGLN